MLPTPLRAGHFDGPAKRDQLAQPGHRAAALVCLDEHGKGGRRRKARHLERRRLARVELGLGERENLGRNDGLRVAKVHSAVVGEELDDGRRGGAAVFPDRNEVEVGELHGFAEHNLEQELRIAVATLEEQRWVAHEDVGDGVLGVFVEAAAL